MNTPKHGDIFERLLITQGIELTAKTTEYLRLVIDAARTIRAFTDDADQNPHGMPRTLVEMCEDMCDSARHHEMPILMAALAVEAAGLAFNFKAVVEHGKKQ